MQKYAVAALRDGDIQSFTDIVNSKDVEEELDNPNFWLNTGREEEGGHSLAELCVEWGAQDGLSTLVRLGAHLDLVNPATGYSALHRAAELGKPDLLSTILKTTNHTFDVNTRTAKRKRGISPLYLAACTTSENHFECVKILLDQPFIEVDCKDSSLTTTPLYAAGKARNVETVIKLIEHGANPDYVVGNTNKTVREYLQTWLPGLDIDKIKVIKHRDSDCNIKEKLVEIVRNSSENDVNYMQNFLKFKEACMKTPDIGYGYEDIVEAVCRKGLADFAQVLFKKGADPNKFSSNTMSCPLIDAAEEGNFLLIKVLKKNDADFTVCKEQTNETVLHSILKSVKTGKEESYLKCLDTILNDTNDNFRSEIKKIINKKDLNGNCALHYSTEKWPSFVTRALLQCGANIGVKNDWGDIPISRIPPSVMEAFLNEDCLLSNEKDIFHKDLQITFKYDFIAPDPATLPDCFKPHQELEECAPLSPKKVKEGKSRHALPETESLWYMGQSREHRHLLKHPVITSFLWFKWQRIRPYFNRNLRLYILFVFLLTWFICVNFGGVSQTEVIQQTFYWLYVAVFSGIVAMVVRDWYKDIQDAIRAENMTSNCKQNTIKTDLTISSPKLLVDMLAYNWIDLLMLGSSAVIFSVPQDHLHIPVLVVISLIILRELLQMAVSLKRYFTSFENWMEMAMIGLVLAIVSNNTEDTLLLNRHLAAIAIVFSWSELITLIGRHPKLLHCNVYVTMFYRVLNSFFFFLLWYSMFIVAFGLGFYIMLHNDDGGDNQLGLDESDQNHLFNRTWLSLVKTSAMFVGELEFSDLPINSDSYLGMLAYVFFLTFIFLIVVVLMNLLNGLAVNDTSDIKQKAEIYSYISRVETISYMESVLLGKAVNFVVIQYNFF